MYELPIKPEEVCSMSHLKVTLHSRIVFKCCEYRYNKEANGRYIKATLWPYTKAVWFRMAESSSAEMELSSESVSATSPPNLAIWPLAMPLALPGAVAFAKADFAA